MINAVVSEVGSWLMVTEEFEGLSLSDFVRDWVTRISSSALRADKKSLDWINPPSEIFKLKFDGTSKGNHGFEGYGCVVCDCLGGVVWASTNLLGSCDSAKAEVMGLLMGLHDIYKIGISKALIEGDSAFVISWVLGLSIGSWRLDHLIHEIRLCCPL